EVWQGLEDQLVHPPEERPRRGRSVGLATERTTVPLESIPAILGSEGFETKPPRHREALSGARRETIEPARECGTVRDDVELAGEKPDRLADGQWTMPSRYRVSRQSITSVTGASGRLYAVRTRPGMSATLVSPVQSSRTTTAVWFR